MVGKAFRPWGTFSWLFGRIPLQSWHLVGALATEDRCLSVIRHNGITLNLASVLLLEIIDEQSEVSALAVARRRANRALLDHLLDPARREVQSMGLFDPIMALKQKVQLWAARSPTNVVLDVSALPKRFFFPVLRWLVANPQVENLVVTYMSPDKYTSDDLAFNAREWAQIPTFVATNEPPDPPIERLVVGVGFLPYGLPELLKHQYHDVRAKVSLFLPFPSGPAHIKRAWEFIRRLDEENRLHDDQQIQRISATDVSGCFDRLDRATQSGQRRTVYAPYGPKPHSVAMCLHAIATGGEVYYTQPAFYHPEYTTGVQLDELKPAGFAYLIKTRGRNLYTCTTH